MALNILETIVFLVLFVQIVDNTNCFQELNNRKFYRIGKCKRSDVNPIARTNVQNLKACMQFARDKNALAFNFSPPEAKNKKGTFIFNCQILGCPELHNFSGLINDTLFDYYSSYGNLSVLENATCVKSIGMFKVFTEKLNYSESIEKCHTSFGDLAHVVSELRTNSLSKLLLAIPKWYKVAYVGLDDRTREGRFETPLGDFISCYKYRAWSPGHPRNHLKGDDCVVLDATKTWRVVNCKEKLPFLCELYPTLPEKPSWMKYLKIKCSKLEDPDEELQCIKAKRNHKRKRKHKNRCHD